MRGEWDMEFVESGAAALAYMETTGVDVLVTDMRMPVMDGAELLHKVKLEHPATARIILSGHSETEAIFRSISSAHQFLAKPCDLDLLKGTIGQIQAAQEGLARTDVKELIGGIEELPALPHVYQELVQASEKSDCTNKTLGAIVFNDVALTAEILHVVNSSFFGLTKRVESIDHAIGMLGLDVIKAVVARHGLFGASDDNALDLVALREHSQQTAMMTRIVSRQTGGSMADAGEGFLAGMIHDLGLLVFAQLPDIAPVTLRTIVLTDDLEFERASVGVDRFAVGSYLLSLWGFSDVTTEAVGRLGGPVDELPTGPNWSLRLGHEIASSGRLTSSEVEAAGDGITPMIVSLGNELRETGSLGVRMDAAA